MFGWYVRLLTADLRRCDEWCEVRGPNDHVDATARSIEAGDEVTVATRRGSVTARAQVTAGVGEGNIYLPMHHPQVNTLTFPAFDPYSRQPSYKHAAAQVRPSGTP